MAGKVLAYELEIKETIEDPVQEIKSIFEFFGVENVESKIANGVVDIETKIPEQLKEKVSSLVIEYVKPEQKDIEKVRFIDVYDKK